MTRASSSSDMLSIAFCAFVLRPANKLVRSVVDAGICLMFVAVPDVDAGTSLFLFVEIPDVDACISLFLYVVVPDVDTDICSM
jgi:hypothetical protein